MNIYNYPLAIVYPLALIGKISPKTMLTVRQWIKTKQLINWKHPRNMQEYVYAQLFNKDTDLHLYSIAADKLKVREYISKTIGNKYLNELYGSWTKPQNIDYEELPDSFVLKTNNGCATNIFVKDKSKINKNEICKTLNHWLHVPYGNATGQVQYSLIKPMIIAEKFMRQSDGTSNLIDYKFYCVNGKPVNLLVCANRSERSHEFDAMVFDMEWNEIPDFVSKNFNHIKAMEKPISFDEMKLIATKLSKPFKFVRIDFYEINGHPVFGEITLTPNMGGALSPTANQYFLSMLQ